MEAISPYYPHNLLLSLVLPNPHNTKINQCCGLPGQAGVGQGRRRSRCLGGECLYYFEALLSPPQRSFQGRYAAAQQVPFFFFFLVGVDESLLLTGAPSTPQGTNATRLVNQVKLSMCARGIRAGRGGWAKIAGKADHRWR